MLRTLRWMLAVAALGAVGGVAPGCGDLQPPVNQVQAGAVEKSVFAGEWYFQQTVIDTPYSSFTFVGNQGHMERIRWEVQEDFLLARRSYEYIQDSESNGLGGPQTQQGAVIAAYRIQSHFDIRRQYNPVTGEENNVITENTSDRPWYERQFMRVDWSQNLSDGSDMFMFERLFDGVSATPVAWSSNDPNSPDAPLFARDANGVNYIDITNRVFLTPENVELWGTTLPSCLLANFLDAANLDCQAHEIGVRNAFLRVNEAARDYQPMLYDGDHQDRFGYFITERAGYNRNYGLIEGERFHFAERHNLWMQSHKHNADGSLVSCYTNTDCEDGRGSVCDIDRGRALRTTDASGAYVGACTIPYRDRQPRSIVYYNPNLPEYLWADTVGYSSEWNSAFVDVVSSLREQECLANGGDADACVAERDRPDALNMFVPCHSPVVEADADACGAVGLTVRPGDLRYSQTPYVSDPHNSSPLGYGPHSADPLTGEVIMANAFVYGAGLDTIGSYARDLMRLLNNDVSFEQVQDGALVQAWVDQQRIQGTATERTADQHVVHIDGHNLADVTGGMDFSFAHAAGRPTTPPANFREMMERAENARVRLQNAGAFGSNRSGFSQLELLDGSSIEREMVEGAPEILMAADIDPNSIHGALSQDMVHNASIIGNMNPDRLRALQHYRDMNNADGCLLESNFADNGLVGLAHAIKRAVDNGETSFPWYGVDYPIVNEDGVLDYELVREMLLHPIFHAVTAHEVGHTLGLRHNFMGSFDALNYQPDYWPLRSDGNMHPRAWDPITTAELDGRLLENQYSTVMDYGVNFVVTDANGIGHYDRAALKMGYGDLVEVFTNAANPQDVATFNWGAHEWLGGIKASSFDTGRPEFYTYTDWPQILGGVDRIQERADVPYSTTRPDAVVTALSGSSARYRDAMGRPMVPYYFGTDDTADLGPDNQRYDQGADVYETAQSVADSYWNGYPFSHFRRQRIGFAVRTVAGRSSGRFFSKLTNANQFYALYRPIFSDIFNLPDNDPFWTAENGFGSWTGASGIAFSMLTRVLTAPAPGTYSATPRPDGTTGFQTGGGSLAQRVNAMDGRYTETTWNFDNGFYWRDQLERVGYTYDKISAITALTDSTMHLIGRDSAADVRRYQLSFATTYGPAMTNLFAGIVGENWASVSPRFQTGGLNFPTPAQLADGSAPGTPIDPATGFTIQLYTAVLGMAYMPETYDQDFLNRARIWVDGAEEGVSVDPAQTVSFTDPRSGLTYRARSYMDGTRETGAGALMIRHEQALIAAGSNAEARRYVDSLDVVRRLTHVFGAGRGSLDPI